MHRLTLRKVRPWLLLALGCVTAFGAGVAIRHALPSAGLTVAYAAESAYSGPPMTVKLTEVNGLEAGKVMIGDREIGVITVPEAGMSGYERAVVVADRLNRALQQGMRTQDLTVTRGRTAAEISIANRGTLLTVTDDDARHANMTTWDLANKWADNLRSALGGDSGNSTNRDDYPYWQPGDSYKDKWVPILSLLRGTRLGVARINGPVRQVDLVQAVAQFSIRFSDFLDIDIYVPISTREPGSSLSRVQGVGVTGLGDIKL